MKLIASLVVATMATLASTAVVATSKLDNIAVDGMGNIAGDAAAAAAPTNNIPGSTPSKPSAKQHRAQKSARMAERRARVKAAIANLPHEPDSKLHKMSEEELQKAYEASEESAKKRGLKSGDTNFGPGANTGAFIRKAQNELKKDDTTMNMNEEERKLWGNSGNNGDPYEPAGGLVEETNYYDMWQQAYRFLGGYIDCSHSWGDGSHDNGNGSGDGGDGGGCSRWMMWAAYVDPNYAGGGYDEYFGDDAPGALDCHSPDTDWKLIGVYRQEFYQFIEQISKHLWAIDEYEYIVALAGLEYMTGDECFGVGYDESGNQLYASIQPLEGGYFQMGLYSDQKCLEVDTQTSYTYDDFAEGSELDLGSKDATDDDSFHQQAYEYWQETQEYTLMNLNTVYHDFRFCTSCVDYPTYQDGYFIGDDGKDDDDLINQCWKFYSHDSFNCDADCIAMGAEQGSISWINYNGKQFGTLIDGQYNSEHEGTKLGDGGIITSNSSSGSTRIDRLKANLFLTFAGIVFVATFLAFAVARGSSKKKKSSRSRSRRLLDADYGGDGRRSTSRSQSRSRRAGTSEKSVRSSRSKSKSRSSSGKSVKSSRSKSRSRRTSSEYEPPTSSEKKKSSRSQSRSRKSSSGRSSSRRERTERADN